ncbi:hypothetical protein PC110_g22039, partial [Phytophthora cactorum]
MEEDWAFLQPWLETLTGFLRHEHNDDLEERGVLASFECWPDAYTQRQKFMTANKCFLRVAFPTDRQLRSDRAALQRVREAMELFDRLAAVDNEAFEELLSQFLIHRAEPRPGTKRMPPVFWPTWECQLTGTLPVGDYVAGKTAVTWGELFGCPEDPWENSLEFRAAMAKLGRLELGTGGNRHNMFATNSWQIFGDAKLVRGDQKLVSQLQRVRPSPMSREINKLFELPVPPVAQLLAVGDYAKMMKTWKSPAKRVKTRLKSDEVEILPAINVEPGVQELTGAIARTDMTTLKLVLSDLEEELMFQSAATVNAWLLFSTLVCGQSLGDSGDPSLPMIKRSGKCTTWDVEYSDTSELRFGAMFSAFSEATTIKSLTLSAVRGDHGICNDPAYWMWLAYAFWSKTSRSSVQTLNITRINLTEAHVSAVTHVLANNYPTAQNGANHAPSAFGYVDIAKGTELRPVGLGSDSDITLVFQRDCELRAYYDDWSMDGTAEVVVPGYGCCKVTISEEVTKFVRDSPLLQTVVSRGGIRSLSLTLTDLESDQLVLRLFNLIGRKLQTLSLFFRCVVDRQVSLDLNAMASACPELKELRLHDWNVTMQNGTEALRVWGVKKLSISGGQMVDGLEECLQNPDYRMSRELVELKVSPNRIFRHHRLIIFEPEYVTSLMQHNKEFLPVAKKKLPQSSR